MTTKSPANDRDKIVGKLFARSNQSQEINIDSWFELMNGIIEIVTNANAVISIITHEGSGTTSFLKSFKDQRSTVVDIIHLTPSSEIREPGWLQKSISTWISSGSSDRQNFQKSLSVLAETSRPIVVCIDACEMIQQQVFCNDIIGLINIADASNLKMSILICSNEKYAQALSGDRRIANRQLLTRELPKFNDAQSRKFLRNKIDSLQDDIQLLSQITDQDIDTIIKSSQMTPLSLIQKLAEFLELDGKPKKTAHPPAKSNARKAQSEASTAPTPTSKINDLLAPKRN